MKKIIWLLGIINAVCLFIVICCTSIQIPTYNIRFYESQYEKQNTSDIIKVDREELINVTKQLLSYMKGDKEDLIVYASIDGEYREFFNQREKDHMVDVKNLFSVGYLVRNISLVLFFATAIIIYLLKQDILDILPRCYIIVFLSLILLSACIFFIISTDFSKYFTIFHELFFTNDLWILDPEHDLLINLVPLDFFINICKFVLKVFAFLNVLVLGLSYVSLKFLKNKNE